MKTHVFRLNPGDDLALELKKYVRDHNIEAGAILTCVGSLSEAHLRFAQQKEGTHFAGALEICGAVGTLSANGNHIHLSVADHQGKTIGGHLLEGNIIRTTAEIAIVSFPDKKFTRETDSTTGYRELKISNL